MTNGAVELAKALGVAQSGGVRRSFGKIDDQTLQLEACPYCSKAQPFFFKTWTSGHEGTKRGDGEPRSKWATFFCGNCGGVVAARGVPGMNIGLARDTPIDAVFPATPSVSNRLPPIPREFLRQAYAVRSAPDAAAMVAGSAVDAMLKHLGYEDGSLYHRIDKALEDGLLTQGMADWAHSVRLGSNRPRHVDKDTPHVSADDANRSVDFAAALGDFLFVLTAQIEEARLAAIDNTGGGSPG